MQLEGGKLKSALPLETLITSAALGFLGGSAGKEYCQCRWRKRYGFDPWEDPLEKEMVTHSSILAWRIPCTEEPGKLQSMGSQRVGHE